MKLSFIIGAISTFLSISFCQAETATYSCSQLKTLDQRYDAIVQRLNQPPDANNGNECPQQLVTKLQEVRPLIDASWNSIHTQKEEKCSSKEQTAKALHRRQETTVEDFLETLLGGR
ncbi:hypothetical protein N7504_005337 [Penicillium tannophilum]|nr:hypothetical protein N7504_005337 [Penicillium tannophilum]